VGEGVGGDQGHRRVEPGAAAAHEVGDGLVEQLGHVDVESTELHTREAGEGLNKEQLEGGLCLGLFLVEQPPQAVLSVPGPLPGHQQLLPLGQGLPLQGSLLAEVVEEALPLGAAEGLA